MEGSFNIDFAHPGRTLRPVKKSAFELLWHRLISREIDIKLGALIIALMILISGTVFYVLVIYIPGSARITKLEKETQKLKIKSKVFKSGYDMVVTKSKRLIDKVNRIKMVRKNYFFWSDKLIEIKRQLVKSLWLYSLRIVTIGEEKGGNKDKKKGKEPAGKKKVKEEVLFSDKYVASPKFKVTIKGTTFSVPKRQPVKLISKFIDGLMGSRAWNKYFRLEDWKINSQKSEPEVIDFELLLVSSP